MLAPLLVAALASGPPDIAWQPSYGEARALAAAEGRVLFCAVNMDGERGSERMLERVYHDRRIESLARRTVDLIGSNDVHSDLDRPCRRFGTLGCQDHRLVDAALREDVFSPDGGGRIVIPQHAFLSPSGELILSVPYEVTAGELEWCFVTALRAADPDLELELSDAARPPRRLILGGVYTLEVPEAAPLPRAQALELIDKHRRGVGKEEDRRMLRRIAAADEPEARDYLLSVLRSSTRRGRGAGRNRRGSGQDDRRRGQLLRWIGYASAPSYWEVCAEFLSAADLGVRHEAVVALEQLGAPESLGALEKELRKEKDPTVKKCLLRAIGSAARDDARARRLLLERARDEREPLEARNALIALGWLDPDPKVDGFLAQALSAEDAMRRAAAALAMALTRRAEWVEALEAARREELPEPAGPAVEAALAVLGGAPLARLKASLTAVAGDEIPRERLFGR